MILDSSPAAAPETLPEEPPPTPPTASTIVASPHPVQTAGRSRRTFVVRRQKLRRRVVLRA